MCAEGNRLNTPFIDQHERACDSKRQKRGAKSGNAAPEQPRIPTVWQLGCNMYCTGALHGAWTVHALRCACTVQRKGKSMGEHGLI